MSLTTRCTRMGLGLLGPPVSAGVRTHARSNHTSGSCAVHVRFRENQATSNVLLPLESRQCVKASNALDGSTPSARVSAFARDFRQRKHATSSLPASASASWRSKRKAVNCSSTTSTSSQLRRARALEPQFSPRCSPKPTHRRFRSESVHFERVLPIASTSAMGSNSLSAESLITTTFVRAKTLRHHHPRARFHG
jgi:hypothetical protein